ncbi:DUF1735 domain-containing protein [Mucilaginibacter sp.]|uniref:DUF1735 domain-containing protein n=1 Tax=Mucilaginibacter sp. TaxID=1882438 RepID=UPI002ED48BFC
MFYKIDHLLPKSLLNIRAAILLGILCIGIASCKKSLNDTDKLQGRLATGSVSYVQGSNVVALNGNNYNFTPYYVGVPVNLTEKAKSTDTVTAVVDPTLVSQYNQVYQDKNPSFQQGAFQVAHNGKFAVEAGATQAKDSLSVVLTDGSQLKDSTIYLVPVTLSAKSGAALKYSLFFFKVFVVKIDLKAKMYGMTVLNGNTAGRSSYGALSIVYTATVPDSLKFRVSLNTLFPAHDALVQATFLTDDEVNAAIIKENFPGYPAPLPVPAGTALITKDLATVPSGRLLSMDSITVKFPNKQNMSSFQWYVMGLKVKSYTASQYGVPPVANDSCRAYIRFFLY